MAQRLSAPLELEPNGPLNLTFAEERAARRIRHQEARSPARKSRGQSPSCTSRKTARSRSGIIESGIHASDLSAVENVEAFDEKLQRRRFIEFEAARCAQVNVPNLGLPVTVARR